MKKTIDFYDFLQEFKRFDRLQGWTRSGLIALFDYLEEVEGEEEIELDVIGLCCEFTEYKSLEDCNEDRGSEYESLDELANHTTVIEFEGGIIVGEH